MHILTFDYDSSYYPAAPMVEVTVQDVDLSDRQVTLSALVDSGADASMLPFHVLETIEVTYITTKSMRGVMGPANAVDIYLATIQIGVAVIPMVQVIALKGGAEAIIGRDVLNHLVVTMNGLAGMLEIVQEL